MLHREGRSARPCRCAALKHQPVSPMHKHAPSRPPPCLQVREAREQAEAAASERDAALGALSALTEQEGADRARVHVAFGQAEDLRRQLVEVQLRVEHLQGDCSLRLEQVARLQAGLTVGITGPRVWLARLALTIGPGDGALIFGAILLAPRYGCADLK